MKVEGSTLSLSRKIADRRRKGAYVSAVMNRGSWIAVSTSDAGTPVPRTSIAPMVAINASIVREPCNASTMVNTNTMVFDHKS